MTVMWIKDLGNTLTAVVDRHAVARVYDELSHPDDPAVRILIFGVKSEHYLSDYRTTAEARAAVERILKGMRDD